VSRLLSLVLLAKSSCSSDCGKNWLSSSSEHRRAIEGIFAALCPRKNAAQSNAKAGGFGAS
jgi:hypothetical protein